MDWYVGPAVINFMAFLFATFLSGIFWATSDSKWEKGDNARLTLLCIAGMLLSVIWPVLWLGGIIVILTNIVRDALPKKED